DEHRRRVVVTPGDLGVLVHHPLSEGVHRCAPASAPTASTAPEVSVTVYSVTKASVNRKSRETDQEREQEQAHPDLTIDDLARRVGMSVRNLREWRALGLLPPPTMRGRVGYYDDAQVLRIGRIRSLHADGFPLDLIRRLLDTSGDAAEQAMAMAAALRSPFRDLDPPAADLA